MYTLIYNIYICCFLIRSDGYSKSGTLVALLNILERIKTQNKVDVFRAVKDISDNLPNAMDSEVKKRIVHMS